MPQKVFFDLDGTIIDIRERYYLVFKSYLDSIGLKSDRVSLDLYYENRRKGFGDIDLVKRIYGVETDIAKYKMFRGDRLEMVKYLDFDSIISDPAMCLRKLKESGYSLYLLSVRKNENNAIAQMKKLKLSDLFDEIVFLKPGAENVKLKYLREKAGDKDIVIGDGKLEIEAAEELHLVSYYVRSGLGTEKEEERATYSVDNYQDAVLKIIGD